LLESDDPEVREKLFACVPFDQIELPPEPSPLRGTITEEDAEVLEYLRFHCFEPDGRLRSVSESVARLKGFPVVKCPKCSAGELRLDGQCWSDPNVIT
jgi:hypothetical protein